MNKAELYIYKLNPSPTLSFPKMIRLIPAICNDIKVIKDICESARLFQLSQGFQQWSEGYPSLELLTKDITSGIGYLIFLDGDIIGYCVIDPDGDSEYDLADNLWTSHEPYAAIHRLALSAKARGHHLSLPILNMIERQVAESGIRVTKVDTGLENIPMQRLLASAGYVCRGRYQFTWGPRLAFEKTNL